MIPDFTLTPWSVVNLRQTTAQCARSRGCIKSWREDGIDFILILDYKLMLFSWNLSFQLVHCTSRKVNRNKLQVHQKTFIWSETEVPEGLSTQRSHTSIPVTQTQLNHDHNVRLPSSPLAGGIASLWNEWFYLFICLFIQMSLNHSLCCFES